MRSTNRLFRAISSSLAKSSSIGRMAIDQAKYPNQRGVRGKAVAGDSGRPDHSQRDFERGSPGPGPVARPLGLPGGTAQKIVAADARLPPTATSFASCLLPCPRSQSVVPARCQASGHQVGNCIGSTPRGSRRAAAAAGRPDRNAHVAPDRTSGGSGGTRSGWRAPG